MNLHDLRGLDTAGIFYAIVCKGDEFGDFLFENKFFSLRIDPFSEGGKIKFDRVASQKSKSDSIPF